MNLFWNQFYFFQIKANFNVFGIEYWILNRILNNVLFVIEGKTISTRYEIILYNVVSQWPIVLARLLINKDKEKIPKREN